MSARTRHLFPDAPAHECCVWCEKWIGPTVDTCCEACWRTKTAEENAPDSSYQALLRSMHCRCGTVLWIGMANCFKCGPESPEGL